MAEALFDRQPLHEVLAGQGIRLQQPGKAALEDDLSTPGAGMRAEVHNMVADLDDIRVMFHHQDGVAFVAQFLQQLVQAVHVVRVQPNAGFIEDVSDIDQAAIQVLDQFHARRFAAGETVGFALQAEISKADIDDILQAGSHCGENAGCKRILLDGLDDIDQLTDLHGRQLRNVVPANLAAEGGLAEAGAVTERARPHGEEGFNGLAGAFRAVFKALAAIRLVKLYHQPQVGQIRAGAVHFEFTVPAVQQQIHLLRRVIRELFIVVEKAGSLVKLRSEHRHADGSLIQRFGHVQHFLEHRADLAPQAFALRAPSGRIIERKQAGVADMRLAEAREQQPEDGRNIGDGAHGRVRRLRPGASGPRPPPCSNSRAHRRPAADNGA